MDKFLKEEDGFNAIRDVLKIFKGRENLTDADESFLRQFVPKLAAEYKIQGNVSDSNYYMEVHIYVYENQCFPYNVTHN
jgi:hypothetical protein